MNEEKKVIDRILLDIVDTARDLLVANSFRSPEVILSQVDLCITDLFRIKIRLECLCMKKDDE